MTASELKRRHLENHPESHFFDRGSMRGAGDRMSNFGVRDGGTISIFHTRTDGSPVSEEKNCPVWFLYRKKGTVSSRWTVFPAESGYYFAKDDFRRVRSI